MRKQLTLINSGRVQGVFFRNSAKRIADQFALVGFARNLPDGKAIIVVEGEESDLRKFLGWSYCGSLLAKVESLSFEWREASGRYKNFFIFAVREYLAACLRKPARRKKLWEARRARAALATPWRLSFSGGTRSRRREVHSRRYWHFGR